MRHTAGAVDEVEMKFDAVDRHGDISGELTDSPSSYPKFRLIALHKNRRGTSPPLRLLPEEPSSQQLPTHRNEARTLDPGRRCTSCTCHRRHIFPYESDSSSSSERTLPLRVVRVGERERAAPLANTRSPLRGKMASGPPGWLTRATWHASEEPRPIHA